MSDKYVSPILMWIIIIIGVIISITFLPKLIFWHKNMLSSFIFILSIIYWLHFFIRAAIIHKKAAQSVSKIDKLITIGIYSKVRHPIYSADIILLLGIFILIGDLKSLISIIWAITILISWIKLEEKKLSEKFKTEYQAYVKKTPMIIPRINLKK